MKLFVIEGSGDTIGDPWGFSGVVIDISLACAFEQVAMSVGGRYVAPTTIVRPDGRRMDHSVSVHQLDPMLVEASSYYAVALEVRKRG